MSRVSLEDLIRQLLERHHLLAAPEILSKLEKSQRRYNKTSVYRALDRMLADDLVCKHSFGSNSVYYELRGHDHDHLVCTRCGEITASESILPSPITLPDFTADHAHVTVFGVCGNCSSN
jgi:Fur family transcriptional regulator, ferric uptake regulator